MAFDPYKEWLSIPPERRPPTYYDLLGLEPLEADPERIHQAAMRRMGKVRSHQLGPHSDLSQQLLAELARARLTLMDPDRKEAYDAEIRDGGVPRARSFGRVVPPPRPAPRQAAGPAVPQELPEDGAEFAALDFGAAPEPASVARRARSSVSGYGILFGIALAVGLSIWGYRYANRELARTTPSSTKATPLSIRNAATPQKVAPREDGPGPLARRTAPPPDVPTTVPEITPGQPRKQAVATDLLPKLPPNWTGIRGARHALQFGGADSKLQFSLPWPEAVQEGTVELWFRLSKTWDARTSIHVLSGEYLDLALDGGLVRFSKKTGTDVPYVGAKPDAVNAEWHHLAGCWDRKGMRLFWDGKMVEVPQGTGPIDAVGDQFTLGGKGFRGEICFVRIASAPLYRDSFEPFRDPFEAGSKPRTLLLYDFREGRGSTVHDQSGHGRDGRVVDCRWAPLNAPGVGPRGTMAGQPGQTTKPMPEGQRTTAGGKPSESEASVKKLPEPDEAKQALARKEIRGLFKDDYEKHGPDETAALAEKLRQHALQTNDDPANRFVLFRESSELAAQAGDYAAALGAVDELAREYTVDSWALKTALLSKPPSRAGRKADAERGMAEAALGLVEEAVAADRYEIANRVAKLAAAAAKKARADDLLARALARVKEIPTIQTNYQSVKDAAATLQEHPDDPDANQRYGEFLCLLKGDWEQGLPLVAKAGDSKLKPLAEQEQAASDEPSAQFELGNAYWDLAKANHGLAKTQLQLRAKSWYEQAAPGLTGLTKAKVEKRLEELEASKLPSRPKRGRVRQVAGRKPT